MCETKNNELNDIDISDVLNRKLVVYNDDYNSFEHVIITLINVCKHTPQQAEQCTVIINNIGKYSVKEGTYDDLKPMKDQITLNGINATIE